MNTNYFFDSLLLIITTLKPNNLDEYFYSIGFTLFKKTPSGIIFIAKSRNNLNNVYHVDLKNNNIIGCVYISYMPIDFKKLAEYAREKYGFSIRTDIDNNTIILIKEDIKCFLRKRELDHELSYKIHILK